MIDLNDPNTYRPYPSGQANPSKTPLFSPGAIVATSNALGKLSQDDIMAGLSRHLRGDWGDLDEHDRKENERALAHGSRLLSAYRSLSGIKFWIITEHDRSVTTVLLPEDY